MEFSISLTYMREAGLAPMSWCESGFNDDGKSGFVFRVGKPSHCINSLPRPSTTLKHSYWTWNEQRIYSTAPSFPLSPRATSTHSHSPHSPPYSHPHNFPSPSTPTPHHPLLFIPLLPSSSSYLVDSMNFLIYEFRRKHSRDRRTRNFENIRQ